VDNKVRKRNRENYRKRRNAQIDEKIKEKLLESLKPIYRCRICDLTFGDKQDMVNHFTEEHDFDSTGNVFSSRDNPDYIILDMLIGVSKKNKNRRYVDISSRELWMELLDKLDYNPDDKFAPSTQAPYWALKKLGLLDRHKGQRERKYRDGAGMRVFRIYVPQLQNVIENSEFDDLKMKCTSKHRLKTIKPAKPLRRLRI